MNKNTYALIAHVKKLQKVRVSTSLCITLYQSFNETLGYSNGAFIYRVFRKSTMADVCSRTEHAHVQSDHIRYSLTEHLSWPILDVF